MTLLFVGPRLATKRRLLAACMHVGADQLTAESSSVALWTGEYGVPRSTRVDPSLSQPLTTRSRSQLTCELGNSAPHEKAIIKSQLHNGILRLSPYCVINFVAAWTNQVSTATTVISR